jgi:hypothetical protein
VQYGESLGRYANRRPEVTTLNSSGQNPFPHSRRASFAHTFCLIRNKTEQDLGRYSVSFETKLRDKRTSVHDGNIYGRVSERTRHHRALLRQYRWVLSLQNAKIRL